MGHKFAYNSLGLIGSYCPSWKDLYCILSRLERGQGTLWER